MHSNEKYKMQQPGFQGFNLVEHILVDMDEVAAREGQSTFTQRSVVIPFPRLPFTCTTTEVKSGASVS